MKQDKKQREIKVTLKEDNVYEKGTTHLRNKVEVLDLGVKHLGRTLGGFGQEQQWEDNEKGAYPENFVIGLTRQNDHGDQEAWIIKDKRAQARLPKNFEALKALYEIIGIYIQKWPEMAKGEGEDAIANLINAGVKPEDIIKKVETYQKASEGA